MSKFRLSMARRSGELKAKEYGYTAFPVDPFEICKREEIIVEPKPPDRKGVSGGIIFRDEGVGIFYATDLDNEGFERFTVAHELGHYFLEGHPEEILKLSPLHVSRAGFTEGDSSIEIEADHFASGLLMPSSLVRSTLRKGVIGLEGIELLHAEAKASLTAAAIRAAECSDYPMAIIVTEGDHIRYGFMSDSFKKLGYLKYPKKGAVLPPSATRTFNQNPQNIRSGKQFCAQTSLADWFDGSSSIKLDEEIVGLGSYGFTLTVFSSELLPEDPDEEIDEEAELIESYTPKFAYGR